MLNNLDLFKVRLIGELVRHESLIGAARELRITSSAVNQNIRKLEQTLGKPLFLRVGKKVKATPIALEIEKRARPFFADLAEILEDSLEATVELRIGAPPIFGTTGLLDQLSVVRKNFPGVKISVSLFDTKKLAEDLLDGKIDFAFVDASPYIQNIREILTQPVASQSLVLCCSRSFHRAHLREGSSLKLLKVLPHLPYHRDQEGIHKWYQHHFGRVPDFSWTLAIDHALGVKNAVLKGWGLGVLPESLVASDRERLMIVPGPKGELESKILLAQNKARTPSRLEKSVLALLLKN